MKFNYLNNNLFNLFLNKVQLKNMNWDDKSNLSKMLKETFNNIQKIYNVQICGLYKVEIYISSKLGAYLEVEKLDNLPFSYHDIELKIIIYKNYPFYLKYQDVSLLPSIKKVFFYKNNFYVDSKYIPKNEILLASERGEFYFDRELNIKEKASLIRLTN